MDTPPNKATQSRVPLVSEFSNEEQNSSAITSAATPVDQLFYFSPTAKVTQIKIGGNRRFFRIKLV